MKLLARLPAVIAAVLLVATFVAGGARLLRRDAPADPGRSERIHLRFAHWHLQSGLREAYDELIADYERLHPHVHVEQLVIPQRVWPAWHRTQLVGGTAPDLIELGTDRGLTDELLARYYVPLTPWIEAPNPYNAGTQLADVPWRQTFIDGLMSEGSFNPRLADFYGVPTALFTIRIFYNRDLLRRITGSEEPPTTYAGLIALCEQTRAWSEQRNLGIIPIAGSRVNAPLLLGAYLRSQLQVASRDLAPAYTLVADQRAGAVDAKTMAAAFLSGQWSFDTPAIRDALDLAREVGRQMQPGFAQLEREDATFAFTRGRALMIATGTFDASSLRQEATFPLGVFALPLPGDDTPRFGRNVIGSPSEASKTLAGVFGLSRQSAHPEQAVDFLRFMTSRTNNARFAQRSEWLPVIVGLEAPESIQAFTAVVEGPVDGADLTGQWLSLTGYNAIRRAFQNNQHLLFSPEGGTDVFIDRMQTALPAAFAADIRVRLRDNGLNIARADPLIASWHVLSTTVADNPDAARRRSLLLEAQTQQEANSEELRRLQEAAQRKSTP